MKVFISAPLRGSTLLEVTRNIQRVIEARAKIVKRGHITRECHTLACPGALSAFNPDEDRLGMAAALAEVAHADEVWFLGDRMSEGMLLEERHANWLSDMRRRKGQKARPVCRYIDWREL